MTPKQQQFIATLTEQRDTATLSPEQQAFLANVPATLTPAQASRVIDSLLALPILVAKPLVADGRYAVERDGSLRFYKVDSPTEGKWAGRTFVKVQASDDYWPIRERGERESILAAIAADPEAALLRYGREIGACGHCGRTLTDEDSRARGIGPVCAAKLGI